MRNITTTCDCGCGEEVPKGGLELTQNSLVSFEFKDALKLRNDLYFVNLHHLHKWVNKAEKVLLNLEKSIQSGPKTRGDISHPDFEDQFYI